MASAFSVCALVENWKVVIPLGGNETHGIDQEDPKWYSCPDRVRFNIPSGDCILGAVTRFLT